MNDRKRANAKRAAAARAGTTSPSLSNDPIGPGPVQPQLDPASVFLGLDAELPLALFPVRLEARFLPQAQPTEIVVRVFPDEIHVDAHDPALTVAEQKLGAEYWSAVMKAGKETVATTNARVWLASQLGPQRAAYVAGVTRPAVDLPVDPKAPTGPMGPTGPTRPGSDPPKPTPVETAEARRPGVARLLPERWAAYVDHGDHDAWTTHGPFWATNAMSADVPMTPALVDLPPDADARGFLDAQGLAWTHRLDAAEDAGLVIRIPLSQLPEADERGYLRLFVLGAAPGSGHHTALASLLDAHRATRGLELLPPGTSTNVAADDPVGVPPFDLDALFDAELGPPPAARPALADAPAMLLADPAHALDAAFGLAGPSALDRTAAHDDPHPGHARRFNEALWPATWGKWITDPMRWADDGSPLFAPETSDFLRAWFADWVRAEGPFATLRIGRQPYGVLPAAVLAGHAAAATDRERLEDVLAELFDWWMGEGTMDAVPTLDPDASDRAPAGMAAEHASDVGAILGATPHIRELRVRAVHDDHDALRDKYVGFVGLVKLFSALVPDSDGQPFPADELDRNAWHSDFLDHEEAVRGAQGAIAQRDAWRSLIDDLWGNGGTAVQEAAELSLINLIDFPNTYYGQHEHEEAHAGEDPIPTVVTANLIDMVGRHIERTGEASLFRDFLGRLGARDELGTDLAPRLCSAAYDDPGSETLVPVLVAGSDDAAMADLLAWLAAVRDALRTWENGGPRPAFAHDAPASLLRHLLQTGAETVTRQQARTVRLAVARIRDIVEQQGAAALPSLERLLRATLGLAMYRLDAWITSLATERLASQRLKRPTGLQVGGYGWLVNLAPRHGRATRGHIHAPSLDHATTAAVLRSGWSAFGTSEAGSPLAVDLSSARVRAAHELIEGVRSGQELGRLLGARFERRLHDARLDLHIDEVRQAVLEGAGQPGRPPTRVVDGLLLARAYTEGIERTPAELAVRDAVDRRFPVLNGVGEAIAGAVADLDAVADVLFAQSVHALLRGDAGVAAPTLAATGSGDAGLPAVDLPATRRSGRVVTVRVLGFLADAPGASPWKAASASVLAAAEPRLEAWLGALLGPPGDVVVTIDAGGKRSSTTLDRVPVAALDAVLGIDALGALVLQAVDAPPDAVIVSGRPAGLADHELAFDEFVTLARAARRHLGSMRPLRAADLQTHEADGDGWDLDDLRARLSHVDARVPTDDPRREAYERHLEEHPGVTAALLVDRIRILAGSGVPVLPLVAAGAPVDLADSFAARGSTPDDRLTGWLAQAARVRPHVDAFTATARMAELLRDRALLDVAVAQSPDGGGEWVGIGQPAAAGAHTGWCSVTGGPPAGPIAGFVVDAWTEVIPTTRTTTGIAVHFDRPSAQAPNAVILAVTRPGGRYDIGGVLESLRGTLRLAQFRAVGADQLFDAGQFLPAVFLPGDAVFTNALGADA